MGWNQNAKIFSMLLLAGFIQACSTTHHQNVPDSVLTNLNPAPALLAPPSNDGLAIDSSYLRSQADYHFTLGEALSFEGRSREASEHFKQVLVYDPQSVEVHLRLAGEFVKIGLINEALDVAKNARKLDNNRIEPLLLIGTLYSALKLHELAIQNLEMALKIKPNDFQATMYLAAVLADQDKFGEAINLLTAATLNADPQDRHLAQYYKARLLEEQGEAKYTEAEKSYSLALQAKPDFEDGVVALGRLYWRQKQVKLAEKLLSSFQNRFGPRLQIASVLADHYLSLEQYDKAQAQLEFVQTLDPSDLNARIKLALIFIQNKQFTEAATSLIEILDVAPQSDKVRFYLGAVYEEQGESQKAIDQYAQIPASSGYYPDSVIHKSHLERMNGQLKVAATTMAAAVELREDVPQLHVYYASLLTESGQLNSAKEVLFQAHKMFPEDTQVLFHYGSILEKLNKRSESLAVMKRVLEADENHVQALNFTAYTLAEDGIDLDQALALALKALELQPNDAYILDTVGWVYFKQQDFAQAVRYLELAHRENQKESIIAEHLGDAYSELQIQNQAAQMYERAIQSETDAGKLRSLQQKLSVLKSHVSGSSTRAPASAD